MMKLTNITLLSLLTALLLGACAKYVPNVTFVEAVRGGNEKAVTYYLKQGALVNQKDDDGNPLITLAVRNGNTAIVKALIQAGADVNTAGPNHLTPLMMASEKGNLEIVNLLLNAKASVNEKTTKKLPVKLTEFFDDTDLAEEVLAAGIKDDAKIFGWTALTFASMHGHTEVVQALLACGADVNEKIGGLILTFPNQQLDNLYRSAIFRQDMTLFALIKLIPQIAELINLYEPDVPWYKERRGLLDGNIEITTWQNWTPLFLASQFGHTETVKALLAAKADVKQQDKYEFSPVEPALLNGHAETLKALLAAKGDITKEESLSLLGLALSFKQPQMIQVLADSGANINAKEENGITALLFACSQENEEAVKILLEIGADVNAKTKGGNTPLMLVSELGYSKIAKLLLNAGADVNAQNKEGENALDIAVKNEREEVTKLLKQAGAKETVKTPVLPVKPVTKKQPVKVKTQPKKAAQTRKSTEEKSEPEKQSKTEITYKNNTTLSPWYITQIKNNLTSEWEKRRPKSGLYAATVSFDIKRDGSVSNVKIEKSSNNQAFDAAVSSAVISAGPFASLPMSYEKDTLHLEIEFKTEQ